MSAKCVITILWTRPRFIWPIQEIFGRKPKEHSLNDWPDRIVSLESSTNINSLINCAVSLIFLSLSLSLTLSYTFSVYVHVSVFLFLRIRFRRIYSYRSRNKMNSLLLSFSLSLCLSVSFSVTLFQFLCTFFVFLFQRIWFRKIYSYRAQNKTMCLPSLFPSLLLPPSLSLSLIDSPFRIYRRKLCKSMPAISRPCYIRKIVRKLVHIRNDWDPRKRRQHHHKCS